MNKIKGFTLIELLIVITIIGILAVALIPRIAGAPARARDVQRKADLQNIAAAMELYFADNGRYPGPGGYISNCMSDGTTIGSVLKGYIQGNKMPLDPKLQTVPCASGAYLGKILPQSSAGTDSSHYALVANLEVNSVVSDSGDGIYCGSTYSWNSMDVLITDLASKPCDGTGDAFYIYYH